MKFNLFKGYERFDEEFPEKQIAYAIDNPEEVTQELLDILKYTVKNAKKLSKDPDYLIHIPAIYLLAYFREPLAFDDLLILLHQPIDTVATLLGSIVSEDMHRVIASVYDGDINKIKKIVENTKIDDFIREDALKSLLVLMNLGKLTRDEVVFYFKELFNGKIADNYSSVWDVLPEICGYIHPKGLMEDIEKATAKNNLMAIITDFSQLEIQMGKSIKKVLDELKEDPDFCPISLYDVENLKSWVGFEYDEYDDEDFDDDELIEDGEFMDFMRTLFDEEKFYESIDEDDEYDDDFDDDDEPDNISLFDPNRKKK